MEINIIPRIELLSYCYDQAVGSLLELFAVRGVRGSSCVNGERREEEGVGDESGCAGRSY